MITKSIIALSALLVMGTASVAFADEDPENKIGDRYPLLEQQYKPVAANKARVMPAPKTPKLDQYINEDVDNKIADRYPLLEQPIRSVEVGPKAVGRIARSVQPLTLAEKAMFDHESARAVF